MTPDNGWSEYQKLVLYRLDDLTESIAVIDEKVNKLQNSVFLLKFKVGLIGTAAGTLGAAFVGVIMQFIFP